MDIRVTVNNKVISVPSGITVDNLLSRMDYNSRVGVWINDKQLLSADYSEHEIKNEDRIKINRIIAGG